MSLPGEPPFSAAFLTGIGDGMVAGTVAGALSGAPSTAHALLTRRDLLESTRAAGTLLAAPGRRTRPGSRRLLLAGGLAHVGLSLAWGGVLGVVLPRSRPLSWGAAAGAAVAALDLGLVGRHLPRVRALPWWPQVADHVCYGAVVGAVVARRRCRRGSRGSNSAPRPP